VLHAYIEPDVSFKVPRKIWQMPLWPQKLFQELSRKPFFFPMEALMILVLRQQSVCMVYLMTFSRNPPYHRRRLTKMDGWMDGLGMDGWMDGWMDGVTLAHSQSSGNTP